jgi:hypothetical protein
MVVDLCKIWTRTAPFARILLMMGFPTRAVTNQAGTGVYLTPR